MRTSHACFFACESLLHAGQAERIRNDSLLHPLPCETLDSVPGKLRHVLLLQDRHGCRATTDTMVLALYAWSRLDVQPCSVLELGCGTGLASIMLGLVWPKCRLSLVDLQDSLVDRAARNLQINDLRDRAEVWKADVALPMPKGVPDAEVVICNPPYWSAWGHQAPKNEEKRLGWIASPSAGINSFSRAAASAIQRQAHRRKTWIGWFVLVFPVHLEHEAVTAMHLARFEEIRICPMLHHDCAEAKVAIFCGVLRSKGSNMVNSTHQVRHEPPIILHPACREGDWVYSEEFQAFFQESAQSCTQLYH